MRKKIFQLLLLIIISVNVNAQKRFKGKITYKIELSGEMVKSNPDAFKNEFGNKSTFYYDSGNYFQTYDGGKLEFDFLDIKKQTSFKKTRINDTLYSEDSRELKGDKLVSKKLSKSSQKILNQPSIKLELEIENVSTNYKYSMKFFFIDEIKIKGDIFKELKSSFSNIVYGETNSIPVKFEMGNSDFKIICTAVNIELMENLNINEMINEKLTLHKIK